jgi:thiamine-phosphate pyrophosphorylase
VLRGRDALAHGEVARAHDALLPALEAHLHGARKRVDANYFAGNSLDESLVPEARDRRPRRVVGGVDVRQHAEHCLEAGPRWIQLRAKPGRDDHHRPLAEAMLAMCTRAGVAFVMNDRVKLAAEIGPLLAHVGQGDGKASEWRGIAPAVRLGRSMHAFDEVRAALAESPAYVAFGPIFPTASKRNPEPVVGLELLAAAHALTRAKGVPLVAIGGVHADNLKLVLPHCEGVAFISALLPWRGEGAMAPFARLGLPGFDGSG